VTRHDKAVPDSSFRQRPRSSSFGFGFLQIKTCTSTRIQRADHFPSLVIPAKAGIQFLLLLGKSKRRASTRLQRAGHFLFNSQEKVTTALQEQREQRSWPRSGEGQDALSQERPPRCRARTKKPCECVSAGRGSLTAHPCADIELARIVRATLRADPACTHRGKGDPKIKSQSKAEHSRAQQSTAEHSRAQQSTAEHSSRAALRS
jgi:hypothetical protein